MATILIENYRGFDIEFSTTNEKFQCIVSDENTKSSGSFTAVKKFIDDYKKDNLTFTPFWVGAIPGKYKEGRMKIVGIRKDGRLVSETENGIMGQVSDYNLSDYMLILPENEPYVEQYINQVAAEEIQRAENAETKKQIIAKLRIITLKDHKNLLK